MAKYHKDELVFLDFYGSVGQPLVKLGRMDRSTGGESDRCRSYF